MQQRYYDPIAGTFLSVDPVTTDMQTGRSFYRYLYGNNNPYKFKDPDGPVTRLVVIGMATLGNGIIQGTASVILAPEGQGLGAFVAGFGVGAVTGAVTATTALMGVTIAGKGLAMAAEKSSSSGLALGLGVTAQLASQGVVAGATAVDATSTAGAPRPVPGGANAGTAASTGSTAKSTSNSSKPNTPKPDLPLKKEPK